MNDVLFEVLKAVIIISIMVVLRYGIPYLKQLVDNTKYSQLDDWVGKAVLMAQQTIIGNETKKEIVTNFIKKLLIQKNISISEEQLNTLIESAVYAMKNGGGINENKQQGNRINKAI